MSNKVPPKPHISKVKCQTIGVTTDFLQALANPVRLAILCVLLEGERSVTELENVLNVHQPSLSQQIGKLREAGLIKGKRVARSIVYHIADMRAGQIIGHLRLLFSDPSSSAIWKGTQFDGSTSLEMD